ncbi:dTDP-4-dehydrorhamnose reductase [Terribacillus saccharophilus]|uniref:dTDP-4-dehydrorhamnose reductase n=1 Tax=Terribacillus saccharophilus TaxID=361277 RepID=UPI000BA5E30D|nr:dTDP-4-dehydrorhamnose reductase [Terribacillus saccharophilus]PAF18123.1 dTDP-4-dehydrorhamnose reductase [Terribacillus saccharophilus]
MKILVTGYTGQLGYDVVRMGENRGYQMFGVGSKELDLTVESEVKRVVSNYNPDVIIHCAAYTAVDKAEEEKDACWDVNVNGTKYLANIAKEIGCKFLFVSTDYVFNGEGEMPFKEEDIPSPIGYYGRTKLEAESIIQQTLSEWFICRISWVFGENGNNFVKSMLRLAETRDELNIVHDQVGSPTYTYDLASLLLNMIETDKYGIYNVSNEGFCSWAEFAEEIFRVANKNVNVNRITSAEYPTPAARPKNSRMSKDKLVLNGFDRLPNWKSALKHYLAVGEEEETIQ